VSDLVVGCVLVALFLAAFTLLAVGALALRVLGLTGRLQRREQAREVERPCRDSLATRSSTRGTTPVCRGSRGRSPEASRRIRSLRSPGGATAHAPLDGPASWMPVAPHASSPATNGTGNRFTSSGRSSALRCPASSIHSSRAPGMTPAMCSLSAGG
jgi:hypothetical protein